ncbi:MAG TPA: hypothetical protein VLF79_02165 [Candidatus Saccharimonadales bacterium]|nr:hypothetical protein [Candidatus Saccharimonadales bacterium]
MSTSPYLGKQVKQGINMTIEKMLSNLHAMAQNNLVNKPQQKTKK